MKLPISKTYAPMEAAPATSLPVGPQWQYEPKWDGFRCLAFRDKKRIDLRSKSGKPLTRYFPELVAALGDLRADKFALDGEIVIPADGDLSFDQLLMRIHPSATRVEKVEPGDSLRVHCFRLAGERGRKVFGEPSSRKTTAGTRSIRVQISEWQSDGASFSPHPADFHCTEMVSDEYCRGWSGCETAGPPVPERHARRDGEDQEVAHRGLRGGRISLSRERIACGIAASGTL
jgi:hypothetical protein